MAAVQTALLSDTFRHTGILQPHLKKKNKKQKKGQLQYSSMYPLTANVKSIFKKKTHLPNEMVKFTCG